MRRLFAERLVLATGVIVILMCALFAYLRVTFASGETASEARTSSLKGPNGQVLGEVMVTGAPNGVIVRVQVRGLSPGWHGMHLHEKADCGDPAFKGSGGHIHAKTPVVHGMLNADFDDAGDLPNLYVNADGTATVELYSTLVTLTHSDKRPALLDDDGSALVIHANPDDYKSQPIGGAGERIACAPIQ
jgi:Cu-Zn family superoxide dismutase